MNSTDSTAQGQDGRWAEPPSPAPPGMALVNRRDAALLAGVSERTVTRWAANGVVKRYVTQTSRRRSPHGEIRFSYDEMLGLYEGPFRGTLPDVQVTRTEEPSPSVPPPRPPRW